MKPALLLPTLLMVPLLVSCTDQETLDRGFLLGAHTTVQLFTQECQERFNELAPLSEQAKPLIDKGLAENREYFVQIDDKKWIKEAEQIANRSLARATPGMTQEKCENMIDAVIKDGGVIKSINDYYPN